MGKDIYIYIYVAGTFRVYFDFSFGFQDILPSARALCWFLVLKTMEKHSKYLNASVDAVFQPQKVYFDFFGCPLHWH